MYFVHSLCKLFSSDFTLRVVGVGIQNFEVEKTHVCQPTMKVLSFRMKEQKITLKINVK